MPCGYLNRLLSLALLALCCALAACSPRQLLVQGVGDALASQVQAQGELLSTELPALDTGFRVFELVDDPDALILQKPLHEATQDDLQTYQTTIATPQPSQLDRVLYNLLLTEGLPLTTRLQTIVDEALYLAADVAILVRSMPLTELTDLLRNLRAAAQPVQHLTVYAPWISDDNFLLGLKTLAESLGLADNALHLRG